MSNEALTFEKVWEALMENREQMKETDRKMQETDRRMKETDRKIGELGNRFGELAEHLVLPGLLEKFNAIGFEFTKTGRDLEFKDLKTKKTLAEVDIFLENGDIDIAVEVKANLRDKDVEKHIARMEFLRRYADERGDKRKYRGAIAAAIASGEMRTYAAKAGFYVIVQSGDTMHFDLPEGFVPRDW